MALKATVFKVQLQIADMDRHYYQDHSLTIAQHPSENNERMMVRLLAFALNASPTLAFTKGLSAEDDEPELWDTSLDGEIQLWVEFGQSDEKWLRKAAGRARQVQRAHVIGAPQRQQPAFAVQDARGPLGPVQFYQPQNRIAINRPAARAHGQPVQRRIAHGRGNRAPFQDCTGRCAIPQVQRQQAARHIRA